MDALAVLLQTPLLAGFGRQEAESVVQGLAPVRKEYKKGETLLMAGYENTDICVVLSGEVDAVKSTRTGEEFLVAHIKNGGIFGDVLAGGNTKSPVTVRAASPCAVLRFCWPKILHTQCLPANLHRRLLANLVALMSDKYFALNERLDLLLTHGLRRRLAAYLLEEAGRQGALAFDIPYNRTALARYLGCERTALAREITGMVSAGLFKTCRTHFELLQPQALKNML